MINMRLMMQEINCHELQVKQVYFSVERINIYSNIVNALPIQLIWSSQYSLRTNTTEIINKSTWPQFTSNILSLIQFRNLRRLKKLYTSTLHNYQLYPPFPPHSPALPCCPPCPRLKPCVAVLVGGCCPKAGAAVLNRPAPVLVGATPNPGATVTGEHTVGVVS